MVDERLSRCDLVSVACCKYLLLRLGSRRMLFLEMIEHVRLYLCEVKPPGAEQLRNSNMSTNL